MQGTFEVVARESGTCPDHGQFSADVWVHKSETVDRIKKVNPKHWILKPHRANCPKCDAIWQQEADETHARVREGRSSKDLAISAAMADATIPARYTESSMWNWQHGMDAQNLIWNWARDFCNSIGDNLERGRSAVFLGSPGTGKTHLAVGILRHVLEKGGTGKYTTAIDLLARVKSTYNPNATETETVALAVFILPDLLVIDEMGRNSDTTYSTQQLFHVLNCRYNEFKSTILISNMSKAEFQKLIGEALTDRIRENGGRAFEFNWASQRNAKRETKREENEE
jgi:DNA replication protein DnaC